MTNKLLTLALGCVIAFAGHAQVLEVESVSTMPLGGDVSMVGVGMSPQGDYVLLSSCEKRGLVKLDLKNGNKQTLTDAMGAGYGAIISPDGGTVLFYDNTFDRNHLRHVAVKAIDVATGAQKDLMKPSRDVRGLTVSGNAAKVMAGGKMRVMGVSGAAVAEKSVVVSIRNRQLVLAADGKETVLSPNGNDKSYLWPSVSPDGTKLLYYVSCDGAYVCNTDGSGVKRLGALRAPQWYGNETVVGMNDTDDGYVVTKSAIVAKRLDGAEQQLTDDSVVAMYPLAAPQAGKIAFSTPKGDIGIINVKNQSKQ